MKNKNKKDGSSFELVKEALKSCPKSMQRAAWKKFFLLGFCAFYFNAQAVMAFAATTSAQTNASGSSGLASQEGESKLAKIKKDKELKKAATAKKEAKEKKKFEYPEPDEDFKNSAGFSTDSAEGVVSAKNSVGLALEISFDEKNTSSEEIWVPFNKKTEFGGVKNAAEIGEGDRVRVDYKITPDKKKKMFTNVTLVSKKPKEVDVAAQGSAELEAALPTPTQQQEVKR